MSSYLVVKNTNSDSCSYLCKDTHTSVPYLKVDTGYLDLTTETTTGTYLVVKNSDSTYRPKKVTTSTGIESGHSGTRYLYGMTVGSEQEKTTSGNIICNNSVTNGNSPRFYSFHISTDPNGENYQGIYVTSKLTNRNAGNDDAWNFICTSEQQGIFAEIEPSVLATCSATFTYGSASFTKTGERISYSFNTILETTIENLTRLKYVAVYDSISSESTLLTSMYRNFSTTYLYSYFSNYEDKINNGEVLSYPAPLESDPIYYNYTLTMPHPHLSSKISTYFRMGWCDTYFSTGRLTSGFSIANNNDNHNKISVYMSKSAEDDQYNYLTGYTPTLDIVNLGQDINSLIQSKNCMNGFTITFNFPFQFTVYSSPMKYSYASQYTNSGAQYQLIGTTTFYSTRTSSSSTEN